MNFNRNYDIIPVKAGAKQKKHKYTQSSATESSDCQADKFHERKMCKCATSQKNGIDCCQQLANCSDPHFSEEGGTIYSNGFFLFRQFWPIDLFIVESCE